MVRITICHFAKFLITENDLGRLLSQCFSAISQIFWNGALLDLIWSFVKKKELLASSVKGSSKTNFWVYCLGPFHRLRFPGHLPGHALAIAQGKGAFRDGGKKKVEGGKFFNIS